MSEAVDGFPVDATRAMRFLLDRGNRADEIINDDRTSLIFLIDELKSHSAPSAGLRPPDQWVVNAIA